MSPKAMTRYRPDTGTVTCADCGELLRYNPETYAWSHRTKGADHAPRLSGTVRHG